MNYLIFSYSFWSHQKEEPPVKVNGDDILFKTDKESYLDWLKDVQSVGFIPSMGKNLFQVDVCQINSELFRIQYDTIDHIRPFIRKIERVPYVNFGILTGRGKGWSEGDVNTRSSIPLCEREKSMLGKTLPVWRTNYRSLLSSVSYLPKGSDKIIYDILFEHHWEVGKFIKPFMEFLPDRVFESCTTNSSRVEVMNSVSILLKSLGESQLTFVKVLKQHHRFPFDSLDMEGPGWEHMQLEMICSDRL
jgi:hypothetical protein